MINPVVFFGFFLLNIVVFTAIFLTNPSLYDILSREDYIIENMTAIALFLSSIFLLFSAKVSIKENKFVSYLLLFIGIVFFFGAGEEISWGQRIFGWETPESIAAINDQNETNLHNVNKKFFDRLVDRATIIFVFLSTYLLFKGCTKFQNIPYPDGLLILCFLITPFYHQYNFVKFDFYHLLIIPLFTLLYLGRQKDSKLLFSSITTGLILLVIYYFHSTNNENFADHNNSANEYREYLFSLCCLYYSYFIYRFQFKLKDEKQTVQNNI